MRSLTPKAAAFAVKARLMKHGYSAKHALLMTKCMKWAALRGNLQNFEKLLDILAVPALAGAPRLEATASPGLYVWEAQEVHPMVGLYKAAEEIKTIARMQGGVVVMAARTAPQSSGALGFYAERLAAEGLVTMIMASTVPLVAPLGSKFSCKGGDLRCMGTNPLCIGIPQPGGRQPIVFDGATSATSWYAVKAAMNMGEALPAGSGVGEFGPTINPKEIFEGGALYPRDGFSGGLGMCIQLLAGRMVNGGDWGHLIIAFSPISFSTGHSMGLGKTFPTKVHEAGGRLPGERSRKNLLSEIPISPALEKALEL